jgi:hypothetical protein
MTMCGRRGEHPLIWDLCVERWADGQTFTEIDHSGSPQRHVTGRDLSRFIIVAPLGVIMTAP